MNGFALRCRLLAARLHNQAILQERKSGRGCWLSAGRSCLFQFLHNWRESGVGRIKIIDAFFRARDTRAEPLDWMDADSRKS
jgi:hypothetical protein